MPFDRLLQLLYPEATRTQNAVPMFSVRFLSRSSMRVLHSSLSSLAVAPVAAAVQLSPYDMTLIVDTSHGIHLEAVYNTTLFTPARFVEMFAQFQLLLQQVLADRTQSVLKYTLLTPNAAKALPDPKTMLDPEWPGPIAHMFHEQAVKRPDRVAVVFKDERTRQQSHDCASAVLCIFVLCSVLCVSVYFAKSVQASLTLNSSAARTSWPTASSPRGSRRARWWASTASAPPPSSGPSWAS